MDREKIIEDIEDGVLIARETRTRLVHLDVDKAEEIVELLKEQEDLGTELTNAVELIHKKNERIEKLLKEQKAVVPYHVNTNYEQHWKCGNCNAVIGLQDKFCHECGTPILRKGR